MLVLPQPKTKAEFHELIRSHGIDESRWLKSPNSLWEDALAKDVTFVVLPEGLATLRYCVYLDLHHLSIQDGTLIWYTFCEEYQEITRPDGTVLREERNLPYLRETWRFTAGESSRDAAERAARDEAGLPHVNHRLLRRLDKREGRGKKVEKSRFFPGLSTMRVFELWGYNVPRKYFDPEKKWVEHDATNGISVHGGWRNNLVARTPPVA